MVRQDHPRIQHTGKRSTLLFHSTKRAQHDVMIDLFMHIIGQKRYRGVSAHSAGIRSPVRIEYPLVILRRCKENRLAASADRMDGDLLTGEKLFDKHPATALPKLSVDHDLINRGVGFLDRLGDDNALARRETIRLNYYGQITSGNVVRGRLRVVENGESASRDVVAFHEFLGEYLAAFETRRGRRCHEGVLYTSRERKTDERIDIIGIDGDVLGNRLSTGVTGRHVEMVELG